MDEIEMSEATLICHTEGCENSDMPLTMLIPVDDPQVWCGPCSQPITDITRAEAAP